MSSPPASFSMYTTGPGSNIVPRGGERDHRQGVRHPVRGQARALERVDGDVDVRQRAVADVLAVVEHRRLVLLALADHDDAVHMEGRSTARIASTAAWSAASLSPHADQPRGGERGGLGHADELEREVAVGERSARGSGSSQASRRPSRAATLSGIDAAIARALLELPGPLRGQAQVQAAGGPGELADRAQRRLRLVQRRLARHAIAADRGLALGPPSGSSRCGGGSRPA